MDWMLLKGNQDGLKSTTRNTWMCTLGIRWDNRSVEPTKKPGLTNQDGHILRHIYFRNARGNTSICCQRWATQAQTGDIHPSLVDAKHDHCLFPDLGAGENCRKTSYFLVENHWSP